MSAWQLPELAPNDGTPVLVFRQAPERKRKFGIDWRTNGRWFATKDDEKVLAWTTEPDEPELVLKAGSEVRRLDPKAAAQEIASRHETSLAEMRGPKRWANIVEARKELIELLDSRQWSSTMIGRFMHRDHTTIIHHLGRLARASQHREEA
jgi:hypothetical protein